MILTDSIDYFTSSVGYSNCEIKNCDTYDNFVWQI